MKKVIYIGAGVSVASVNVVNAGCCDSNNGKKSISLSDVEISFMYATDNEKVDCKKIDDDIKKNFGRYSTMFNGMFKFEEADIASNVSIFTGTHKRGFTVYILVGTDAIVDKQEADIKSKVIQKLGDSGLNVCCIMDIPKPATGVQRLQPLPNQKVSIAADKDKKTKFNIKLT